MNPAINPEYLTNLANLNLDLAENQPPLEKFYKWANDNIVKAVKKEVKKEHGLDLRRKVDKLKFAQEIAKKELEKLGGELMYIPNQFISKVKDLMGKGKEIGKDQVRLSVIKEILELEHQIVELEHEPREELMMRYVDDEDYYEQDIKLSELLDNNFDGTVSYIPLWDQQTELVSPILEIMAKYDRTYRFKKRLCSEADFMGHWARPQYLLESLFNFGLICNDLETEIASSVEVEVFKGRKVFHSWGDLLLEASKQKRWDILAALLKEQKEPSDVKTFWKTYFLRKKHQRKLEFWDELLKNLDFIRDCPQLKDLCVLGDHINQLEMSNHCQVANLLGSLPRGKFVINDHCIDFLYSWFTDLKTKLDVENMFSEYFGISFSQLENHLREKFSSRYRYFNLGEEFLSNTKEVLKQHYQTLGLTINATIDEVKKQYRKLAQKFHPDLGGDAEKMKSINEAYEAILASSG